MFYVPYHFGQLAYADHMALQSFESPQIIHQFQLFVDSDLNHMIAVDTPKYLVAGNSYPVVYRLVWGDVPDTGLEFQIDISPIVSENIQSVRFDESNREVSSEIIISSSVGGKEMIPITYYGTLVGENTQLRAKLSSISTSYIIPAELKLKLQVNRIINFFIALISLAIVVWIFIVVW